MIEVSINEAQKNLTKILKEPTLIVDQKHKIKRAVVLPFEEYEKLIKTRIKEGIFELHDEIDDFVGILNKDFKTDDKRYKKIVK